jgi:hypothetical protein
VLNRILIGFFLVMCNLVYIWVTEALLFRRYVEQHRSEE